LPENFNVGEIDINTIVLNDLIFAKQFPIRIYYYDGIPEIIVPYIIWFSIFSKKGKRFSFYISLRFKKNGPSAKAV
jgi:hypothetical protein